MVFNPMKHDISDDMRDYRTASNLPQKACPSGVQSGRRDGLMVSVLDSGASGPGSGPGRGHCVVFLGKNTRCLSSPRCINGYRRNAGGNPAMD